MATKFEFNGNQLPLNKIIVFKHSDNESSAIDFAVFIQFNIFIFRVVRDKTVAAEFLDITLSIKNENADLAWLYTDSISRRFSMPKAEYLSAGT